jgi:hypothetical protein
MNTHDTTRLDMETLAREMFPDAYAAITDDRPMDPALVNQVADELARRQLAARRAGPAVFTDMADLSRWQPGTEPVLRHTEGLISAEADDDEREVHIWLHLPPGANVTIRFGDPEPAVTAEPEPDWAEPGAGQALARMTARSPHLETAVEELGRLGCEFLAPRHRVNSTGPGPNYVRFRHPTGAVGYLYPSYIEFRQATDADGLAGLPAARRTGPARVSFTHEAGLAAVRWLIERNTP